MTPPRIVILTGERSAGKSTVCSKTVDLAQARGYTCGGIVTLRRAAPGCPTDCRDVLDVRTGLLRQFTVHAEPESSVASSAVVQGRFRFNPQTLAWAKDVLVQATPSHLLVVDELGPLEIIRGQGWQKAFDVLNREDFRLALVVVRPELVDQARLRLPPAPTTTLAVTHHNRDTLPGLILETLEQEPIPGSQ
jgi:nucleoside-triphosphatase THEP1